MTNWERLIEKPVEFWGAIVVGVTFVFMKHQKATLLGRSVIASISFVGAVSFHEDVGNMFGVSENLAGGMVALLGYAVTDLLYTAVTEPEERKKFMSAIADWIIGRMGRGPK